MSDLDAAHRRAADLAAVGRFSDAERIVRAALAEAPDRTELLTLLAYLLRRQERYLEALEACEAAIAADPDSRDAHE